MKRLLTAFLLLTALTACKKKNTTPSGFGDFPPATAQQKVTAQLDSATSLIASARAAVAKWPVGTPPPEDTVPTPPKDTVPVPGNRAPVASFTTNCTVKACAFVSTSTDPDGDAVSCRWSSVPVTSNQDACNYTRTPPAGVKTWVETLRARDSKGMTHSVSKTVTLSTTPGDTILPPPPPPPVDTTPVPPPPPPPTAGPVDLPKPPALLTFTPPTVTGKSLVVNAGDNLQNAINSAQPGDEIVLTAGATWSGNFTLPAKAGAGWVVIRSDKNAQLKPRGTRVTAGDVALMGTIMTVNAQPALQALASAKNYWISGVHMTVAAAYTGPQYGLVKMGQSDVSQTLANMPTDLVLDRVIIEGAPTTMLTRCLELNSARTEVSDSRLMECHNKGFDSQAILIWNGSGPFKITNNRLEGAGENFMSGGADPKIKDLVPADIEFRRNYVFTPPAWGAGMTTKPWTKKNLFELKQAERVLVEGNVFDGSWADGQTGAAFRIVSNNQGGNCKGCRTGDVTFRYNIIRNAAGVGSVSGWQGGTHHPVTTKVARVLFEHNIAELIGTPPFAGMNKMFEVSNGVSSLTMRRNTFTTTASIASFLSIGNSAAINVSITDNIFSFGTYGICGTGFGCGEAVLPKAFLGTLVYTGNVMLGTTRTGWPLARWADSEGLVSAGIGADRPAVLRATAGVVTP